MVGTRCAASSCRTHSTQLSRAQVCNSTCFPWWQCTGSTAAADCSEAGVGTEASLFIYSAIIRPQRTDRAALRTAQLQLSVSLTHGAEASACQPHDLCQTDRAHASTREAGSKRKSVTKLTLRMRVLVHARKEQQVIAEEQQALLMADPSR